MEYPVKYYDIIKLKKVKKNLEKNFFDVIICETKKEAMEHLLSIFHKDSIIGYGGSKTVAEIGFYEKITKKEFPNLLERKSDFTPDKKQEVQRNALSADFFLCSANGLSEDGQIVLIDKWGNRNAGATYGPAKRIFIIGKNKIEPDISSAIRRAQNKAAIINNLRFDTKNPCTITGECMDCQTTNRLCSITTILHKCQPPKSALVILINENLGF